jgi:signal transduction histidine kinase
MLLVRPGSGRPIALVWAVVLAHAVAPLLPGVDADPSLLVLLAISAMSVGRSASARTGRDRIGWGLVCAGWAVSALGVGAWVMSPQLEDAGLIAYNLYYPLVITGLALQVRRPADALGWTRFGLDVGGVLASAATLVWMVLPGADQAPAPWLDEVTAVGEVGVMAMAAAVLHGRRADHDLATHLLVLGTVLASTADLAELTAGWVFVDVASDPLLAAAAGLVATAGLLPTGLRWPAGGHLWDGALLRVVSQVPILVGGIVFGLLALAAAANWLEVLPGLALASSVLTTVTIVRLLVEQRALDLELEDRSRREEERLRTQRLEVLGQLSGVIVHDLNNVLTVIQGCADELAERTPASPAVNDLNHANQRGAELTRQLLRFIRQGTDPGTELVDPAEAVAQVMPLVRRLLGRGVPVVEEPGAHARLKVDRGQLEIALLNLALNARDALTGRQGGIRMRWGAVDDLERATCGPRPLGPGRWYLIAVEDDGIGMDAATLARAKDPFFTTKPLGTGLGLHSVASMMRECGSVLWLTSQQDQGTRVELWFPIP